MPLVDRLGRTVTVGRELGRGGEGTVFEVAERSQVVAKLYHQAVSPVVFKKIVSMASLQTDPLLRIAAWPIDTLTETPGGIPRGLLMPRMNGCKPIHLLYGPQSRLTEFPTADWRFIVHASANLARAFAVVHDHGQVVGDVNHGNVLVGQDATVRFIDCDSFQITAKGQRYFCDVGVPTHQPPEFQSLSSYRGVVRTPNHDNFGLAVLIFQLLMLGRHPFAGTFLGSGEMPLERAIREYRFAYGARAASLRMRQPPYTPPLSALSLPIATFIERAFAPEGSRDGGRPSAADWSVALDQLERDLRTCPKRAGHVFSQSFSTCPWCEIENKVGLRFFPLVVGQRPVAAATFNLALVWADIESVSSPGPAPRLAEYQTMTGVTASSKARNLGYRRKLYRNGGAAIAVVGVVLLLTGQSLAGVPPFLECFAAGAAGWWVRSTGLSPERAALVQQADTARDRWRQLEERWRTEAGDKQFSRKRADIAEAHRIYLDLPARRQRDLQKLELDRRERQLRRYLRSHRVSAATIKSIGPGREATLTSYGVETAYEVTPAAVMAVPGFGERLTQVMLDWRNGVERGFRFDPSKPIDPADLQSLFRDLDHERERVELILKRGAAELRALQDQAIQRRRTLQSPIDEARRALAQAEADFAVL